jgi:predicted PurR-regulated permease PerM
MSKSWSLTQRYFMLALAIAVTVVPPLIEQITILTEDLQTILLQLEETLARPIDILGFELSLDSLILDFQMLSADFVRPDLLLGVLEVASTNLGWALVILVTTYSLLQDWPRMREWLIRQAPESHRPDARRLYEQVRVVWESYLRGQLSLMVIIGVATGLASAAIEGLVLGGFLVALMVISLLGSASVMGHYIHAKILDEDPWFEG